MLRKIVEFPRVTVTLYSTSRCTSSILQIKSNKSYSRKKLQKINLLPWQHGQVKRVFSLT